MNCMLLVVVIVLVFGFCLPSESQDTFVFENRFVNAPIFDADGKPLNDPAYVAELYGGATAAALSPLISFTTESRVMVPVVSGWVSSPQTVMIPPPMPEWSWAWLQLRTWDSRLGSTYEDVLARGVGGYGESPLFYACGGAPSANVTPGHLVGLESFSVRAEVPEPGTVFLLVLGFTGLGLWRWHGKKRSRT